jgi:hypothetical protein
MAPHPNTELVAMAWIASIPAPFGPFSANMVATQPPAEQSWPGNQDGISNFITVTIVGGTPLLGMPIAQPVIEVKAYATKPGSNKPPWFAANDLLERIWLSTMSKLPGTFGRVLTIESNGVTYASASCIEATVHTEPRRLYSDPRNWACYAMDMSLVWREAALVIR